MDILPSSKTHDPKDVKRHFFLGNTVPIFCANCGLEGGRVSEEYCHFAFWLCNTCVETHGEVAGLMGIPDEVFWAEVAADKLEQQETERQRGAWL